MARIAKVPTSVKNLQLPGNYGNCTNAGPGVYYFGNSLFQFQYDNIFLKNENGSQGLRISTWVSSWKTIYHKLLTLISTNLVSTDVVSISLVAVLC